MKKYGPEASPSMAPSEWASAKEQLLQFLAIVAVAATVAFLGITLVEWQKRRSLPFCDTKDPYSTESCIPCPENGRCVGGDLDCSPGFTRQGRFCLRDRETREAAKVVENYVVQQVCGHHSLPLCKWVGPERLTIFEVTQLVETAKLAEKLGIDPVKVRLAKEQGISDAGKRLIHRSNIERYFQAGKFFLFVRASVNVYACFYNFSSISSLQCPTDLLEYYKPYWCRTFKWILSNYSTFLVVFPIVLLMARILRGAYHKQKVSKRAEQLYMQVCETLEEKAQNKVSGRETWVVASHLRDHLLTFHERQSNAVWLLVEQMVSKDSRIDQYPKLIKGESKVVWEWQVEGILRSPGFKGHMKV